MLSSRWAFARDMHSDKKLKLIDLSQPLYPDCPCGPSDPPLRSRLAVCHEKDGWQVEQLTLTSHTGSHVEAPLHKIPGAPSISDFPLERFVGAAVVVDLRGCRPGQPFTSSMLARKLREQNDLSNHIILLATGWGTKRGAVSGNEEPAPFLAPDGADWLLEQEVRGVGMDCLSIGGFREPSNSLTHQKLLEANIWILEDLRFPEEVFALPQPVQFWALPIHLERASAAFCRPVIAVQT